jgi:uncharacterized protein
MIVEIIDCEERISAFLPLLGDMVKGGLISLEEVRVLHYGSNQKENRIRSSTPATEDSP